MTKMQRRQRWRPPTLFNIAVMLFILAPLIVVIGASFNSGEFTSFPPRGFSLHWYRKVIADPGFVQSAVLSARVAVVTAVITTLVGTVTAIAITRLDHWFTPLLQFLALGPLILPEVLLALGVLTLLVGVLEIRLSEATLILAHVVITLPFVVNLVTASLSQSDRNLEAAARTLGAGPITAFRTVILPSIAPSAIAGGLFSFIFSFDNIGMSLFLSVPGLVPLPIRMYQYVTYRYDPTIAAASTVLIIMSAGIFLVARRLIDIEEAFGGGKR